MFHLDLKLLRSFVAVAAESSVTRAAARLHLSQPTVSGQIKQLEEELGFALFHRSTRTVVLTPKASQILPLVTSIIDQCMKLKRDVEELQSAKADHFTLGAAMFSMDFPDRIALLDSFATRHPSASYVISNQFQCMQVQDLLHGRLDAALLLGLAAPMASDGKTQQLLTSKLIANECVFPEHLERVVLRRKPVGLLLPADCALAQHAIIPREELAGSEITMLSPEHGAAFLDPLTAFFDRCGCTLVSPPEGNALAIERYAERTHGIAIGIGWFPTRQGMVWRAVQGLDSWMEYSLLIAPSANKAARRLFAYAKEWAKAEGEQAVARAA